MIHDSLFMIHDCMIRFNLFLMDLWHGHGRTRYMIRHRHRLRILWIEQFDVWWFWYDPGSVQYQVQIGFRFSFLHFISWSQRPVIFEFVNPMNGWFSIQIWFHQCRCGKKNQGQWLTAFSGTFTLLDLTNHS